MSTNTGTMRANFSKIVLGKQEDFEENNFELLTAAGMCP